MNRKTIGNQGEQIAEQYLRKQGLKYLNRNVNYRFGEIDLVMLDSDTIAFIEVRVRSNPHYGSGAESVTASKQRKLIKAAHLWIGQNRRYANHNFRFDVISLTTGGEISNCLWYKDAFRPDS